jgi:hypothetical protein
MKRLSNHVSPAMHEEVIEQMCDNTLKSRYLKQQATNEYLLAKRIVTYLPIAPTNNLIYKVWCDIEAGYYDFLNDIFDNDNFAILLDTTREHLIQQGILFDDIPDNTAKYLNINDALTGNR